MRHKKHVPLSTEHLEFTEFDIAACAVPEPIAAASVPEPEKAADDKPPNIFSVMVGLIFAIIFFVLGILGVTTGSVFVPVDDAPAQEPEEATDGKWQSVFTLIMWWIFAIIFVVFIIHGTVLLLRRTPGAFRYLLVGLIFFPNKNLRPKGIPTFVARVLLAFCLFFLLPQAAASPKLIEPVAIDEPRLVGQFPTREMLEVGKDIPAGEYYIVPAIKDGWARYFVHQSPDVNADTLHSNSSCDFMWVVIEEGEYLYLGAEAAIFPEEQAPPILPDPTTGRYSAGIYRVGKDIPPATLRFYPDTSEYDSYYCVRLELKKIPGNIKTGGFFEEPFDRLVEAGDNLEIRNADFEILTLVE